MKGTNADKAKKMIEGKSKQLGIYYEEDFDTAAQMVCKMVVNKWKLMRLNFNYNSSIFKLVLKYFI